MKRKVIYLLTLLLTAMSAVAQDYDALLKQVVGNNTELSSLESANESQIQALRGENNLPETGIDLEHQWGQKNIGNKWSVGISQGFEWPGIYGARNEVARSTSEAMEYLNRSNYLEKMLEVKLLFIDIVNARKNLRVMEQVCDYMSQLKTKYHDGFKQGEVSILDVNKIDIEHVAVSRRCNELRIQLGVLQNSLKTLNGGKDCSEIISMLDAYPEDVILSEDAYETMIKQNDPQLKYNSSMLQSQSAAVRVARMGNLPGFTLGYMHVNELGSHFNGLKIGISLPLFSNRHKSKAAEALRESIGYEQSTLEIAKLSTMYSNRAKAVKLYSEVEDYRGVFEKSDNLALLKKALDGGEITLLTYLQEVNYFLEAQRDYMNLVYEYHYTLAQLNKYCLLK